MVTAATKVPPRSAKAVKKAPAKKKAAPVNKAAADKAKPIREESQPKPVPVAEGLRGFEGQAVIQSGISGVANLTKLLNDVLMANPGILDIGETAFIGIRVDTNGVGFAPVVSMEDCLRRSHSLRATSAFVAKGDLYKAMDEAAREASDSVQRAKDRLNGIQRLGEPI